MAREVLLSRERVKPRVGDLKVQHLAERRSGHGKDEAIDRGRFGGIGRDLRDGMALRRSDN
jgi:hypothetical protein